MSGLQSFSGFLHRFALAKLATTSIRVKMLKDELSMICNEFPLYVWKREDELTFQTFRHCLSELPISNLYPIQSNGFHEKLS